MGRRSRKRAGSSEPRSRTGPAPASRAAQRPEPTAAPARRRRRKGERPPAPWGNFPLVELCVLLAIVIGIAGFLTAGSRGSVLLACAAVLGSLAGLELSLREHFAGYKSHSTILAGTIAVVSLAALFVLSTPYWIMLAVSAAVFATAFWALREAFRRRSGGLGL